MASKKRNFMLKSIDSNIAGMINMKYGLVIVSQKDKDKEESVSKTTKISDIISSLEQENSVSFLDENKKNCKCSVTMADFVNKKKIPEKTDIQCFWCKHSFSSMPIGCPIKFVNSSVEKSYVSHITKDKYYMKENITKNKLMSLMESNNSQIEIQPIVNDYYLTDGIFCSFNCVLSFIKDNNHDMFYRESYFLLHSLYEQCIGQKIKKMTPAPHWRLLKNFGGHLSIEEFRESFNIIDYEFAFNLRDMKSISKVYKEKV
jgi:hypothetical protein